MSIKKGTKLTDTPKDKVLRIRIDDKTENELETVCKHTKMSKSDVVRKGIEQQYDEIKK
mgnify:FL=1